MKLCRQWFISTLVAFMAMGHAQAANWQTPGATPVQVAAMETSIPAPATNYFQITAEDVAREVAKQLQLQAIEQHADVSLGAGSPKIIHSADHPIELTLHALQIDPDSRRWQAQANVRSNGKTETVRPVGGTYMPMVEVPVLKHQVSRTDIIEASDLESKLVADRQIRKDTITDPKQLIGQSPRATITADRPIRLTEVSSPVLVKRGQPVELTYTSAYMSIKATGIALQDGAKGELIRVKNEKSEKAVSGRVAESGRVEVNQTPAI